MPGGAPGLAPLYFVWEDSVWYYWTPEPGHRAGIRTGPIITIHNIHNSGNNRVQICRKFEGAHAVINLDSHRIPPPPPRKSGSGERRTPSSKPGALPPTSRGCRRPPRAAHGTRDVLAGLAGYNSNVIYYITSQLTAGCALTNSRAVVNCCARPSLL
jgi:hypothetical protein